MEIEFRERLVRQYFECFANKDRDTLLDLLEKKLRFRSSYAEYDDRDVMLDEIWPLIIQNNGAASELKFFHASDGSLVVKYELSGHGVSSMAELFHFNQTRITGIEVFIGKSSKQT